MQSKLPRSPEQVRSLADRLAAIPSIARLSTSNHNEPWTLAHSLADIADSSEAYLERLPAALRPDVRGEDLVQLLIDLGAELEHMLYHLEDPRFLRERFAPLRNDWEKQRAEQQ